MNVSDPLVSVVLPVYNRPEKVCKTIESILNQTYENFELIVIDNASTDNTVDEIRKIKDNRIKLLVNAQNMGQTYSINRGLQEARGKYIARIDSDDIALPNRLEKQVQYLEQHEDYVLCGSWVRFINDNDELTMTVRMCSTDEGFRFMQTFACGMYHPAAMYRKSLVDEYGITYDSGISMAEDYDLWAKLLEHGKGMNIPEVLVYYRRGNSNDSKIHVDEMRQEGYQVRERIINQLDIPDYEKEKIFKEIELEKKSNKTLMEAIKVALFYRKYLKSHFSKKHVDYVILKQHILLRVYATSIYGNSRMYAKILLNVYIWLKSKMRR